MQICDAQRVLQAVYSLRGESWADTRSLEQLLELAKVANQLACACVLQLCDHALGEQTLSRHSSRHLAEACAPAVVKCGAAATPDVAVKHGARSCLKPANVCELYWQAHRHGLKGAPPACVLQLLDLANANAAALQACRQSARPSWPAASGRCPSQTRRAWRPCCSR